LILSHGPAMQAPILVGLAGFFEAGGGRVEAGGEGRPSLPAQRSRGDYRETGPRKVLDPGRTDRLQQFGSAYLHLFVRHAVV